MRRQSKIILAMAAFAADTLGARCRRLARREGVARGVILYYHAVTDAHRAGFARQLDLLLRWARPLRSSHEGPLPSPGLHVAVTFDDGFISVNRNALPELQKRGIPSTIFMPTGCFGEPPVWVRDPQAAARRETVMDRAELKTIGAQPLVEIGSHTIHHPRLPQLEAQEARRELAESKQVLEEVLGRPVPLFSFPHGAHTPALLNLAREVGYRRVFGVQPWVHRSALNDFLIGRVPVEPYQSPLEFTLKLNGAYRWFAHR